MQDFTLMMDKAMEAISTDGAFLTVKNEGIVNTMTIAWGFVGFMWRKPHFITVVRPTRYTNDVLEEGHGAECYTISVPFKGKLKNELTICGTKSGRDIDKSQVVSFTPAKSVASPIVANCDLYYECKLNMVQALEGWLLPPQFAESLYPDRDFHIMYWGEIIECYAG